MGDAGAELKQDPGAGIADPGGHTAEARRGIDDLLHKGQALFRCCVLVSDPLCFGSQCTDLNFPCSQGCTMLIYQAVPIPISVSPHFCLCSLYQEGTFFLLLAQFCFEKHVILTRKATEWCLPRVTTF